MNRVYKVIWSKAKHCYVVTSEIARSVTKSASSARSAGRKGAAVLAMAALLFTAGGVVGHAANVTDVTAGSTANVITVTKDAGDPTSITIDNVDHAKAAETAEKDSEGNSIAGTYAKTADVESTYAKKADIEGTYAKAADVENTYAKKSDVESTYAKAADVESTYTKKEDFEKLKGIVGEGQEDGNYVAKGETLSVSVNALDTQVKANADAVGQETVDRKLADKDNLKVDGDGVISKVTGDDGTTSSAVNKLVLNKDGTNQITMDENGIKVGKNSTTMDEKGFYAGSDYDYGTAKAALDATEGKIRGADGDFEVNTDGKVTAKGGVETAGAEIKTGGGSITAGKITGTELNTQGGAITGGMATVTGLTTQGGDISGGNITATGLNTQGGEINGGDIKSSGTIHATGKITGNGLDAGTGAISGGSLSVTGAMEGNSLTLKGGNLNAGSGTITTTGDINGNNINTTGKITTKDLEVTGGLKTDHITLGSEDLNQTDINKGKVTSKIHEISGAVEYTAESIFNKDGSSITVRTNEGRVDSTGSSTVGSQIITQYLGNNAVPGGNNVTRRMVRNDNGTFSMVDTAVVEGKSSTVSQNAGERKVTVAEGTKNLNITENLTNGIVSETQGDDGTVTLTQGMDGTYKVVTSGNSTEDIGGQKVENYKGGLATEITGDETHHVTQNQTITVTGKSSLSAADIENKASSSIWNHVGEGYNTSWKMTDGTVVESVKDVSGKTNQITTTAADTYQFVKDGDNTLAKRTSSTNDNLNITDSNNTYTKITTATGNKQTVTGGTETASTNLTKEASNTLIKNGTQSVLNHIAADTSYTVMNENGNGSRQQQTASEILDRVTDGKNTSEVKQTASEVAASAKDISNTATDKIISQIGEDGKVKSEMNAEGITNTAENGTITNKAQTVNTITGKNTVTSKTEGTTFVNTGANAALKKGNEQGSRTETRIFGNQVETGKVETDFADVNNNLTVGGSTTLGRDGNTNLTVNSKSEFKDTVKMEKTLDVDGNTTLGKKDEDTTLTVNSKSTFNKDVTMNENATVEKNLTVNGESTFNNKVTITKNGLDVTGGTTTDKLEVKGTSEFGGKAAFKDDVSMGKNLTVTGKTETGILHVNGDGYVGGDLNVEGNIETHDAELSENSRQVVTGRQLYQTNERVDRLDNRIKKVGANAAALAALRPGDFNPDDKFSIAAGFGSYRNANAAALGLFYRPNENVLLSLGTSFGDGENMVNAGVSVKFGRGKSMAERRKEMADEVSSMRDEMRSQDERIAELEEMLKKQSELIEKLSKES